MFQHSAIHLASGSSLDLYSSSISQILVHSTKLTFNAVEHEAVGLCVSRYGRPDPLLERPFDISATVRMSSVRYLHTMRFLKEILAFLSHFPQLIDALQRMKAKTQGTLVGVEGVGVRGV